MSAVGRPPPQQMQRLEHHPAQTQNHRQNVEGDVYVSSDSLIEEKESSLSKSNFGNNNLNKTFIDGIEVTIKEKIREEIGYKIELDIEYDVKDFEITKVKVSSKNIRSIKQENDKNLINNIILDEIDIDEKLIIYDY